MNAEKQSIYITYTQNLHIKGIVKGTIALYSKEAESFLEYIDDLESLTTRKTLAYLAKYSHLSSASKNSHYSSLRAFIKHLSRHVYYDMNKIKIPYIKIGRKLPEILDVDEFIERVNAVKKLSDMSDNWMHKRDYALVMLLYATGMRVSEAIYFKLSDIESGWVRIDSGKGLKDRVVPVAPEAIEALEIYAKICPYSLEKNFFLSNKGLRISRVAVYKILKKSMRLSPHSMRHHFATHMINNGADVSVVSELLGHSSLITTQIYTHIKKAQLAETANKCHPMEQGEVYAF